MKSKDLIIPLVLVSLVIASFAYSSTKPAVAAEPQQVFLWVDVYNDETGDPYEGWVIVCNSSSNYSRYYEGSTIPFVLDTGTWTVYTGNNGYSDVDTDDYDVSGNYYLALYVTNPGPLNPCSN